MQDGLTESWSFEAIGTNWWIGIYEPVKPRKLQQLKQLVAERIELFDQTYSRFRADSLVSQMAKAAGTYALPEDSEKLFELYAALYEASEGAVTPLIGQLVSDAGYDAEYSLQAHPLTVPPTWEDTMQYNPPQLTLDKPALLDFGAAGKGYLADIIGKLLQSEGVERFCVDASGDIVCRGLTHALQVGLEHPNDPTQVIGVIEIAEGALCGSAGNRRAWGEFTHMIDPRTLRSPRDVAAVWVKADDGLTADGLATVLFFTPAARLRQSFDFEYCIVHSDEGVECTELFQAALFAQTEKAYS